MKFEVREQKSEINVPHTHFLIVRGMYGIQGVKSIYLYIRNFVFDCPFGQDWLYNNNNKITHKSDISK